MEKIQITKNFHSGELECPCCKALIFDQRMIDYLQILRDILGRPFVIDSFFRCRFHNSSLSNSSPRSQHLLGKAVDISTKGWTSNEKWRLISSAFTYRCSVGIYAGHIHLDVRIGDPKLWYGSY